MTKLTKYDSFKSLKQSAKSNPGAGTNGLVQLPELESFFNILRQNFIKTHTAKNDKAQ